ncbi:hypothetical protein EYF80_011509 [Liparis tanakae]|uniref:Uncharacterized protein n=1 Tax=Liparis tanakae TaxID=230148 RepID=A0A4Z2IJW7_9TELE|nr:hypothetical protein EYF80_011509 [Liparis tanakae]
MSSPETPAKDVLRRKSSRWLPSTGFMLSQRPTWPGHSTVCMSCSPWAMASYNESSASDKKENSGLVKLQSSVTALCLKLTDEPPRWVLQKPLAPFPVGFPPSARNKKTSTHKTLFTKTICNSNTSQINCSKETSSARTHRGATANDRST